MAKVLGETLDQATGKYLEYDRSPSRRVGELDNRGSHFYLSMYWAENLANQIHDIELQQIFRSVAKKLFEHQTTIVQELLDVQGKEIDMGGYYHPNEEKISHLMRPSKMFNDIIDALTNRK